MTNSLMLSCGKTNPIKLGSIPTNCSRQELVHFWIKNGIKPIPIHEADKKPLIKNWVDGWNYSRVMKIISHHPFCNLGIGLGNIIDIEADSIVGNNILSGLFKKVPTLSFTSSRSRHYIFINPGFQFNKKDLGGIEIRAYRHLTVIPPSIHISGERYKWTDNGSASINILPDKLYRFFESASGEQLFFNKNRRYSLEELEDLNLPYNYDLKRKHRKVQCPSCGQICYYHKKRLAKERLAFQRVNRVWVCKECREIDVRPLCKQLSE